METLLTLISIGTFMIVLVAMHLHLTARPPEEPVDEHPADDIDAEFLRIIGREWLGEPLRGAPAGARRRHEHRHR